MSRKSFSNFGRVLLVVGVIGLLVGAAVAPNVWERATGPDGTVAVVEMHGTITGDSATEVIDNLREARQNDSIRAVVLDINSPGGAASASEQLYLAVKRTQQEMPVVVSVTGMAASGGYYMTAPADEVYVTPASTVGSVGVRAVVPGSQAPSGEILTGPDKGSTSTNAEVRRRVEALRRAFVGSVMEERSESLKLTEEELSYAKVYSGARGVKLGLADSIGGIDTAIQGAADRAGLSDYAIVRMESPKQNPLSQLGFSANGQAASAAAANTQTTFDYQGVDTVQYLMLHGSIGAPSQEVKANESQ
ncbi:ClpP class periplasmic serine protease [Halogeometricum borinquense DSM 11551]|uniref:ClpP class periplasmic serine protease n=2 Tax=Halogeometricum borinquense TaxID=60847 RepID=E4NVN5_HALBP|nr:S49 family peptidase [Halogeometricum borinquense]ADQ68919.1 ClpP class periplasmic serine protease [Halogeometricum borinquense DSM 11551]ELY28951.1 ClpP class periplasmic serine protease [Halogeometricum borinquense DSM 11551]RYJ08116.1 S49 family peptidase [Halogeometricum borinquense]